MKWQKYLTAGETAGLAMGLDYSVSEEPQAPKTHPDSDEYGLWPEYYETKEAFEIYKALIEEYKVAEKFQYHEGDVQSEIVISDYQMITSEYHFSPEHSRATRESLGNWFFSFGEKEKALLFNPEAEEDFRKWKSSQEPASETPNVNATPSSRTPENHLLEAVGIMAILLAEAVKKYKSGVKSNSSQIASAVEDKTRELFGLAESDRTGLSNLQKDISEGVKMANKRIEQLK